jgi:drug/metabolite transporter (DMT)-like permease
MNIKTKAWIFITLAMVGGALFPLALKVAVEGNVNIYSFLFLSYILATAASLVLVVAKGKTQRLREYLRNPREYLTIGIAGFAFAGLGFYGISWAEQSISATLATVIFRMQPLLMLLFLPILLRERVSKTQVAALLLAFAGIYIAVTGGALLSFSGAGAGVVLVLFAIVLVYALAGVFIKRYTTDMECTMFMFNSTSLLFATALFLYAGAQLPALNPTTALALLYIGVPTSVGVTYFYFRGFRTLKTTFVANYYCLSPFITALFAAILLNETIQPYYLVIAALVAIGIAIQRFDKKGGTYMAKNKINVEKDLWIFDVTGAFHDTQVEAIRKPLSGGGRVLAMKLNQGEYCRIKESPDFRDPKQGKEIFVYTNADDHLVSEEKNNYLSDILKVNPDETILMSAGDLETSERFLGSVKAKMKAT